MSDRINPETLYNSVQWGFSHAAVSEPGRLLHLAGQVAWDKDCQLVGGDDLNAQARQCLANLKAVLADQGLGLAVVQRCVPWGGRVARAAERTGEQQQQCVCRPPPSA